MSNYKPGDKVISIHTDAWCAPEGMECEIIKEHRGNFNDVKTLPLYEVLGSDNNFYRHYEDELKPAPTGCDYCNQGKSFNINGVNGARSESYIIGNELITYLTTGDYDPDNYSKAKIKHCPFCGSEVHEEPDEEMEEEVDE